MLIAKVSEVETSPDVKRPNLPNPCGTYIHSDEGIATATEVDWLERGRIQTSKTNNFQILVSPRISAT